MLGEFIPLKMLVKGILDDRSSNTRANCQLLIASCFSAAFSAYVLHFLKLEDRDL